MWIFFASHYIPDRQVYILHVDRLAKTYGRAHGVWSVEHGGARRGVCIRVNSRDTPATRAGPFLGFAGAKYFTLFVAILRIRIYEYYIKYCVDVEGGTALRTGE